MNRYLILLSILLCSIDISTAQNTKRDSLEAQLKQVTKEAKIPLLIEITDLIKRDSPMEALQVSARAEALLETYPNLLQNSRLMTLKGWAQFYLNEYDNALNYAKQAQQMAETASDFEHKALSLHLKARIYRDQADYDRATAIVDSALAFPESEVLPLTRGRLLNEAGTICRRKGESVRALDFHTKALELIQGTSEKSDLAATFNFLGIIHDIIGNYDQALRFHLQSLDVRKELHDRRGMAASMTNIGTVHQRIEQLDQALDFYEQSLPIWQDLDEGNPLASTLNNIGAVQELLGNYESALKYYQDAYRIWNKLGHKYSTAIALDNLGTIYMHLDNSEKALDFKRESLRVRMELGDQRGSSQTLTNMAIIFLKLTEPDSALHAARRSLEFANETESWTLIRNAHEALSTVYEFTGDFEQALMHYRDFKAANDTLFNAESQSVIAELQEEYRSREQQQKIDLLQREKEVQRLWMIILIGGFLLALLVSALLYNRYMLKVRSHRTRDKLHRTEMEKARLQAANAEAKAKLLQVENKRKSEELEAAKTLQLSMLPDKLPENKFVSLATHMETATEVGGDYYDMDLSNDDTLTLCIGDATGHGSKAGILVTAVKSLFSLMAREKDLVEILQRCSSAIKKMNLPQLFMAFAIVRLKENRLELAGAGMPPALIYRASSGQIESIELKGMPLGSVPEFPFKKHTIALNDNDVVVLLTDGFPELSNSSGKMAGYELPAKLLAESGNRQPDEIVDYFCSAARKWIGNGIPNDDMTFIVLKKKPVKQARSTNRKNEIADVTKSDKIKDPPCIDIPAD